MQWEYDVYYVIGFQDRLALVAVLDTYGAERWELVTVLYNPVERRREYYFKRQLYERI